MEEVFDRVSIKNQKNIEWFNEIRNGKRPHTYEIELFIEIYNKELNTKLKYDYFLVGSYDEVTTGAADLEKSYFYSDAFFKKMKRKSLYRQTINLLSFINEKLAEKQAVEQAVKLKGFTKDVMVPMYLKEQNIAIICDDFNNDEDIINLLKIPNLTLYVATYMHQYGYILVKVEMTKSIEKLLNTLETHINQIHTEHNDLISKISTRYEENTYLSLEDKQACLDFYHSLDEDHKRTLTSFLSPMKGKRLVNFIAAYYKEIMDLSDDIMCLEYLFKVFIPLFKYEETNKEKLQKDRDRNYNDVLRYYGFKNRFSDYRLLEKELDKKALVVHKWMNKFYEIVNEEKVSVKKQPNVNSLHYKAAVEASEELSKLWFISEVTLFGSVAKGEETADSDIDLAFKFGIDVSNLTDRRLSNLHSSVIKGALAKVEAKYENLMEAYPKYTDSSVFQTKLSMFNLLSLSVGKKKDLAMYEKTGFFEHAVTFFKRDSFEYQLNDIQETIHYKDIECVIFPTDRSYSYFIKTLMDDKENRYLKYYKHNLTHFETDSGMYNTESVNSFEEEVILVHKIDKFKGFGRYSIDRYNLFKFYDTAEFEKFIEGPTYYYNDNEERDYFRDSIEGEISKEIDQGGIRLVKKDIHHPFIVGAATE